MFFLEMKNSDNKVVRFNIGKDSAVITIGRRKVNDVVFPDPEVSRNHAQVLLREGVVMVEDLNSANGTKVNGEFIKESTTIIPGDQIIIGNISLTLRQETGDREIDTKTLD